VNKQADIRDDLCELYAIRGLPNFVILNFFTVNITNMEGIGTFDVRTILAPLIEKS
jgi:hypothetical protein